MFVYCIGWFVLDLGSNTAFITIFQGIITINLSLMLFNLIPIYPLDGSHLLATLLGRKMPNVVLFLQRYGRYILIALLLTGLIGQVLGALVSRLFTWMFRIAMRVILLF